MLCLNTLTTATWENQGLERAKEILEFKHLVHDFEENNYLANFVESLIKFWLQNCLSWFHS